MQRPSWADIHGSEYVMESAQAPSTVLVTGGAGYIGSVLVRRLLAAGHRVRVLDRLLFGAASMRSLASHPRFALFRGDCRRLPQVTLAVDGADAVIHLAAIVGDAACSAEEQITWQTNCEGTEAIVRACRSAGVARMLFASTCSVYGATDGLVNEEARLNPLSLYATSKAVAEQVAMASTTERFHPTVLRLGTAFGWSFRPRFDLVVNLLAAQALRNQEIKICNRDHWRPFIHVSDIARAFCLALAFPLAQVSGRIFNAGSSRMNHPLSELQEAILDASPQTQVSSGPSADPRNYRVCFERIKNVLDFECEVSLRQGVHEVQQQLRMQPSLDYTAHRFHNHTFALRRQAKSSPAALAGVA
jgi:nucleoside-diphosphate-sugar epimerase